MWTDNTHHTSFYVAALQTTNNAFEKCTVNSDNFTVVTAGCFKEHQRKTAERTKKMSPELYRFQVPYYIFLRFLTVPNLSCGKNLSIHIWNSLSWIWRHKFPWKPQWRKRQRLIENKLTNERVPGSKHSWLIKLDACFSLFCFILLGSSSWHLCFAYYLWPRVLFSFFEIQEWNGQNQSAMYITYCSWVYN